MHHWPQPRSVDSRGSQMRHRPRPMSEHALALQLLRRPQPMRWRRPPASSSEDATWGSRLPYCSAAAWASCVRQLHSADPNLAVMMFAARSLMTAVLRRECCFVDASLPKFWAASLYGCRGAGVLGWDRFPSDGGELSRRSTPCLTLAIERSPRMALAPCLPVAGQ